MIETYIGRVILCDLGGDVMPTIKPQPGPQENFLACPADIAIYGGS